MTVTEVRLDELGSVSRGRSRHRPRDAEHLYGGPYPFVQTGDIKRANLYLRDYSQTYSDAGLAQSKLWPPNTLCITIAANIADTAILDMKACFPDSVIGFVADEDRADVRYIKYLLDTIKAQYQQVSRGATQDNLSQEKLLSFKLLVPNVTVQRRVADVLSAYDDLIENNTRRIKLLEDAARLLYEEWFVRLRFPGHEHTPIHNSVPEGWERVLLSELLKTQYGYTKSARDEIVGPKYLRGTDINKTSYIDWAAVPYCPIDESSQKKFALRVGDIVIIRMADPGKVAIIEQEIDAVFASYLIRLSPVDNRVLPYYLFFFLSSIEYQGFITGSSTGATRKSASAKLVTSYPVLVPPLVLQRAFDEQVRPMRAMMTKLLAHCSKLREARDLLLPRLMSGEVAV